MNIIKNESPHTKALFFWSYFRFSLGKYTVNKCSYKKTMAFKVMHKSFQEKIFVLVVLIINRNYRFFQYRLSGESLVTLRSFGWIRKLLKGCLAKGSRKMI